MFCISCIEVARFAVVCVLWRAVYALSVMWPLVTPGPIRGKRVLPHRPDYRSFDRTRDSGRSGTVSGDTTPEPPWYNITAAMLRSDCGRTVPTPCGLPPLSRRYKHLADAVA